MNLLFLIGNGFDINLGLKTGYPDFYRYYKTIDSQDPDILAMKESIEKDSCWSDLEHGLGVYSEEMRSKDVFLKCVADIKEALTQYLISQRESATINLSFEKMMEDLTSPEDYLDELLKSKYNAFLKTHRGHFALEKSVSVVTFNYTDTLETILTAKGRVAVPILHIHGKLPNDIVLGVSDLKQIANNSFRTERDVREEFIKPEYNKACLNMRDETFVRLITSADVIILFGSSLGETDRKWWRLIGSQLQKKESETVLFYFVYDKKKDTVHHPNHRLRWTEQYQKEIISVLEIPEDRSTEILARIYIGINKDIFKNN